MKTMLALSLGVLLGAAVPTAMGQTLPALPSGFQADAGFSQMMAQMRTAGVAESAPAR
jgi:hypothetical protein